MFSMTGYGKGEYKQGGIELTVEIKTVNNRYLDVSVKSPKIFNAYEEAIRAQVREKLTRGHADLFINFVDKREKAKELYVDVAAAKGYYDAALKLKTLFPGYVFLISEDKEALFFALKKVVGLTKLVGTGEEVVPLTQEEIRFLMRFGRDDQVVEMSEGIIENQRVIITSGPLQGNEGLIKRIDRHKRKAYLEMEMFGRKIKTQVGLEIVRKR